MENLFSSKLLIMFGFLMWRKEMISISVSQIGIVLGLSPSNYALSERLPEKTVEKSMNSTSNDKGFPC